MTTRIPAFVHAEDPLSQAGLEAALTSRPEVTLIDRTEIGSRTVAVEVADPFTDTTLKALHALNSQGCSRVVLITDDLPEDRLIEAVEAGVCAFVRRGEATADRLAELIVSVASGEATFPSDLLGRLLQQISRMQRDAPVPLGGTPTGLSERETRILRLVSEGLDTREIARRLNYSERTVKSVLHDVTSRYHLKNRAQAVAFATREGWI
ncbi:MULTISPECIES: response regulator transcription factor [unclassified Streptomyces]|uniref:Response regulator transcription factor n=1 Tax=Streptomyces sp. NBC_00180 TaxID=2903632 RepID=A0AAU1I9H3_9ACTN|nr:response regulator transcription factor [Streptomyces sp. NBC_01017]WSV34864.1 response regulator transcription factor [Streptomyces sp. NBC_01017]